VKDDRLVYQHGCHCAERRWVWDNGEREQQRWVELRWRGSLVREEVKWRRSWVVRRVINVKIIFLIQWRVWVGRYGESGLRWWCRFNGSVLPREAKRQDEALSEDEAMTASSSWLNRKEVWHSATTWWRLSEERWHRAGEREKTASVGLTRILLGQKWKKFTQSIQLLQMDGEDLKQRWVNLIFFSKTYVSEI
jgi:hypothetical protein